MDNISSGPYVEDTSSIDPSSGENVSKIWLNVVNGEDWPKIGYLLWLSLRNLKSRDQILKDDGLCSILVVKKATVEY